MGIYVNDINKIKISFYFDIYICHIYICIYTMCNYNAYYFFLKYLENFPVKQPMLRLVLYKGLTTNSSSFIDLGLSQKYLCL